MTKILYIAAILHLMHLCAANNNNIITKEIGRISFFERNWQQTFDLNLKSYIENALILRNSTGKLTEICDSMPAHLNCVYFQQNIASNSEIVTRELNQLTKYKRAKRSFWGILLKTILKEVLLFVGVVATTELIYHNKIEKLEESLYETNERIEKQFNVTVLQNGIIVTSANHTMELQRDVINLNKTVYDLEKFNELMHIALQALMFHNKETNKFLNIIKGDFRANFFNIVDLNLFTEKIEFINTNLGTNGHLPTLNPFDLLDLSELTHSENETHISIHVKMPILTQASTPLYKRLWERKSSNI